MKVDIQLTDAPIPAFMPPGTDYGSGAWVEFRGVVREAEDHAKIAALEYEAYASMAEKQMRRIVGELSMRHPCLSVQVIHRVGIVPVGEAAVYVGVSGKHRAEALGMLAEFMDRLKQDVPIWKTSALTSLHGNAAVVPRSDGASGSSATEVMRLVRESCSPLGVEPVSLNQAGGRVLAQAVIAPEAQPAFDRSSVDGYAVRVDDQGSRFQVVGELRAGDWNPLSLKPGEAVRIATGAALPSEGLQVVMKEDVRVENDRVTVLERSAELNVRFRGEDARAGQELVARGTVLTHGALGLLASIGCVQPMVSRLPRVVHIVTGNEVIDPERSPAPGQIRDSNSTLVRAFLQEWGITPEQRRVAEDEEAIWTALEKQDAPADLLLISGGASVGEHDFTRRLLERAGFKIQVSKTNVRPGKPLIVARKNQMLAFGLPGNPLAHFVCLNLYVRSALESWSGELATGGFRHGILANDLSGAAAKRETFWPAQLILSEGTAQLIPLRWSSSGDLTALARANALIHVPGSTETLLSGTRVEFFPTGRRSL